MQIKHTEVFNSLAIPPPDFRSTVDFYPLCNDKVFKEIFSQPEFMEELKLLTYAALAKDGYNLADIREIDYAKTEFTAPHAGGKTPRFDINLDVIVAGGEQKYINIEMQRRPTTDYRERAEYYISVAVVDSLESGRLYSERPDISGIHLLNYEMFKNSVPDKYLYTFRFREDDDHELVLPLTPKIHFVELPKIRAMSQEKIAANPMLSVLKLISLEEKEKFMEQIQTNSSVGRLANAVLEFNRDTENVKRINYTELLLKQEGMRERAFGRQEGKVEGVLEGIAKITKAISMLQAGKSPESVAEGVDLPLSQVCQLQSQLQS
jgi:predicted transposase/invertase (TIGR01784 family)